MRPKLFGKMIRRRRELLLSSSFVCMWLLLSFCCLYMARRQVRSLIAAKCCYMNVTNLLWSDHWYLRVYSKLVWLSERKWTRRQDSHSLFLINLHCCVHNLKLLCGSKVKDFGHVRRSPMLQVNEHFSLANSENRHDAAPCTDWELRRFA